MNLSRGRGAFTLVEVLIALAIFALAAVVLGAAYINVLNAYSRVADAMRDEQDVQFARHALLLETDREEAEEGGEFETADNRSVRWEAQIEPTEVADLFDVTFSCELGRTTDAEAETIVQRFRLLRPTWSIEDERETRRREAADRIAELNRTLPGGEVGRAEP